MAHSPVTDDTGNPKTASAAMATEVQRKVTTILAADAEGYSRKMEADELGTLDALRAARGVFPS